MKRSLLLVIVSMHVLSLKNAFAFPIKVRGGDSDMSIRLRYNLKPSALEAANPNVNFKRYLISGMILEIPLIEKSELDAAFARNDVLVKDLDAKEKEFTTLGERYAKLEKEYASVKTERDTLQPIADLAERYKMCASILFTLLVGTGILLLRFHRRQSLLLSDLGALWTEQKNHETNIQQLKSAHAKQLLDLQMKLTGLPRRPILKTVPKSPKE